VVLRTAKKAHVGVGQVLVDDHRLVVGPHKGAAPDVLVGQGLAKALGGRCHRAPQQQLQLGDERLAEDAALLLQQQKRQQVGQAQQAA
jgi:hypothetical protein